MSRLKYNEFDLIKGNDAAAAFAELIQNVTVKKLVPRNVEQTISTERAMVNGKSITDTEAVRRFERESESQEDSIDQAAVEDCINEID